jgi:tRNA/tmRNA/rRNA uracil-C5-methylase (TrmA/RlmC/RlmD family)
MTNGQGKTTLAKIIETHTTGWQPTCACGHEATRPCVVLDPFMGAGTVGLVAKEEGREFIGIELNPKYAEMATRRIAKGERAQSVSLFAAQPKPTTATLDWGPAGG